jgi:hypothetical protein
MSIIPPAEPPGQRRQKRAKDPWSGESVSPSGQWAEVLPGVFVRRSFLQRWEEAIASM